MTLHITWMWLIIPLAVFGGICLIPTIFMALFNLYNLIGFMIKGDEWG